MGLLCSRQLCVLSNVLTQMCVCASAGHSGAVWGHCLLLGLHVDIHSEQVVKAGERRCRCCHQTFNGVKWLLQAHPKNSELGSCSFHTAAAVGGEVFLLPPAWSQLARWGPLLFSTVTLFKSSCWDALEPQAPAALWCRWVGVKNQVECSSCRRTCRCVVVWCLLGPLVMFCSSLSFKARS